MVLTVSLHVYDVSKANGTNKLVVKINDMTHVLGFGGVFHGGIAVDNVEWSYGYSERSQGVYSVEPMKNPMYRFRETVPLGETPLTRAQIREVVLRLRKVWIGSEYDFLGHNCCHFCEVFARELQCKPPPGWLNRFAQSADVARSLGARSAALLRASLSKMLLINNHRLKAPEPLRSSSAIEGRPCSLSCLDSSADDRCGAAGTGPDLRTRSSGAGLGARASPERLDLSDSMFCRPALYVAPIMESTAEPPCPFSRCALPLPECKQDAAQLTASESSRLNKVALETMFGRPASALLEDTYLQDQPCISAGAELHAVASDLCSSLTSASQSPCSNYSTAPATQRSPSVSSGLASLFQSRPCFGWGKFTFRDSAARSAQRQPSDNVQSMGLGTPPRALSPPSLRQSTSEAQPIPGATSSYTRQFDCPEGQRSPPAILRRSNQISKHVARTLADALMDGMQWSAPELDSPMHFEVQACRSAPEP